MAVGFTRRRPSYLGLTGGSFNSTVLVEQYGTQEFYMKNGECHKSL